MKKIYLNIGLLFIVNLVYSQVGINTDDPQQPVHVAGPIETIRIDGLSSVNNPNNLGTDSTTPVHIDDNGDLVLGTQANNIEILFDSENYLTDGIDPSTLINQTGGGFGYTTAGIPVGGTATSFTLTANAIVEINYSVSWSVYKTANASGRIADEHARIVQTGVYFRQNNYLGAAIINDVDGNPINDGPWCIDVNSGGTVCNEVGGLLAINGQFYNNGDSRNGEYENFHNTGSDYVKLGPGTYTAMFAAQLAVGDTGGTGAVKMYIGTGNDDIQIIAHYYQN
ncbi:hypothetical protein [Aurantibacter sp.]|uniref:hypothetical protein n=1 Tax=Aurantibacter sp. TaxID=2807103 RepID=UPI0035C7BA9A